MTPKDFHTIMMLLGIFMLVYGLLLRRAFNRNFNLGYGLAAQWLVCGSILAFLLAFTKG